MSSNRKSGAAAAGPTASSIAGRYRVIDELGRGGNAVVYRVRDVSTGQELALKQLAAASSVQRAEQAAALFEREYYQLAQLAHPHVIEVYDYGLDAAGRFYTMELLDGGDLKQLSPMPHGRACRLMLEVCSSLALLHSRRLVHRDVTPRNVRCTRDGHAKLIDFGALTPMGLCSQIAGTPAFIAPEVVQKADIDGRADLFSLGATLYYVLTGRPPFAVRQLSELLGAYARQPIPPSQLAPGVPEALDQLCAALLRIDPAQRPRSAFEVMHKLEAISGVRHEEPVGVSQAYLTTPALCGREGQLRAFRQRVRRALHGSGGALLFRSEPGLGRSRMLDACALEAKTQGMTVLRAGAGGGAPFALATRLCEQLLQALPEAALQAAQRAQARAILFESSAPHDEPRLRSLDAQDRQRVQAALSAWFAEICAERALLLLVDDLQRLDEPSLAWLAALALAAPDLRLQLSLTVERARASSGALDVIIKHCSVVELLPLTRFETESLLRSVFGAVPNVPVLAERLYGLARGNPRETLLLARHLADAGLINYGDGQWTLPAQLRASDLPANAGDAWRARIEALSPLARTIAQTQALLGMRSLSRGAYAHLVPDASVAQLDAALLALIGAEILQSDHERYQLSHPALVDILCDALDEAERQRRHLALYRLQVQSGETHPYVLIPHLVAAGHYDTAFEVLEANSTWLDQQGEDGIEGVDATRVADSLERMLELSAALGRAARDAHELRRRLCAFAVVSDDALHARVAPAWLAQLCHDSGLADYRASRVDAPAQRLERALAAATARYEATPPAQRVYRVDEAIRQLAVYNVTSIVISVRSSDGRLMQSLPGLLEPFAVLSPALNAIWQNVVGLVESYIFGRRMSAARRHREVYERLSALNEDDVPYLQAIRGAIGNSLGWYEASIGSPAAFDWADKLDTDRLQCVAAMEIRRMTCLVQGDAERAEGYEKQAELRGLRAHVRRMFDRPWALELETAVLANELGRIKRVMDEATPLAAKCPAWQPFVTAAEGYFLLLRGDPQAAQAAFTQSLQGCDPRRSGLPAQLAAWLHASAGSMAALSELGRDAAAVELGERALARCSELGVELGWHRIARALAASEAVVTDVQRATARIEHVIADEERAGVHGLHRAASYHVRALIAVRARDLAAARQYAELAVQARGGPSAAAWAQAARLVAQARRLGLQLDLEQSALDRAGKSGASERGELVRASELLSGCATPEERATRVLTLLCRQANADSGHLYLVGASGALALAATRGAPAPSPGDLQFVHGFFAQQVDDAQLSDLLTRQTHTSSVPGVALYCAEDGLDRQLIVLSCKRHGELVFAGLAVVASGPDKHPAPDTASYASALAAELLVSGDTRGARG